MYAILKTIPHFRDGTTITLLNKNGLGWNKNDAFKKKRKKSKKFIFILNKYNLMMALSINNEQEE